MTQNAPKHTPGPWQADDCPDANGFTTIRHADGGPHGDTSREPIATIHDDGDVPVITAAPDLLRNLKMLLGFWETQAVIGAAPTPEAWKAIANACNRAAATIEKAEGRA